MPHLSGFLPADLHIVSQVDLLLLQRGAVPRSSRPEATRAGHRSSPWPEQAVDRVLDELERREMMAARCPTVHGPTVHAPRHSSSHGDDTG
ncbi:hypothetical protein D6T63_10945 [Arthrobacter cheniae]|jgi:hypothetical protein|uniref:Uncharacterized protein n=1 Tax=Arthrobacter cheniae TaxID=1258888 RepID=A0A3A5MA43_9MICC|nr:hypothetical protein [Arthrobacter cheniae]RJT79131.1 hypothetical protein D6T63_10945 [Arthrobacter cheniae]